MAATGEDFLPKTNGNVCLMYSSNDRPGNCFPEEGRYDSLTKAESKVAQPWKQKSLDEKRLRFVMKRTSFPAHQLTASNYINHGVLSNHRASTALAASSFPPSHIKDSPRKLSMLSENQQMSFGEFSDSDCLLEDSDREAEGGGGGGNGVISSSIIRNGPVGRFRDTGCQTGDDLVQVMFLQLRRRRFQNSPGTLLASPQRQARGAGGEGGEHPHPHVKEVTFSTQVVPVHVDSAWSQSSEFLRAEQQPLLGGELGEEFLGLDRREGDDLSCVGDHRRFSNLSSQSYRDGRSTPEGAQQDRLIRRCSDTAEMPSSQHHTIYHRPPTPRTPRKLLIQNNHNDISADGSGGVGGGASLTQALPRDALPSPHVLHVNRTPTATPTSPSLSSLLSQGSCCPEGTGTGKREGEEGSGRGEASPKREAAAQDKGVIEFQQYLLHRGLSLDMTTVQTSNL